MDEKFDCVAGGQINGARDCQEDAFRIRKLHKNGPDEWLLVLADGMGGHVGGARASQQATTTFTTHFERTDGDTKRRLRESLDAANSAIGDDVKMNPHYAEMGCTLLACVVAGNSLRWLSVGDSPLWVFHENRIIRLNEDHSMRTVLQSLVEMGRMSAAELERDNRANQLRSVVVGGDLTMVDENHLTFELSGGDQVILASDGLETLTEDEIAGVCREYLEPAGAVAALLAATEAKQQAGQDNTTAVIYRHNSTDSIPFGS